MILLTIGYTYSIKSTPETLSDCLYLTESSWELHTLEIRVMVNWQQLKKFEKGSSARDKIFLSRESHIWVADAAASWRQTPVDGFQQSWKWSISYCHTTTRLLLDGWSRLFLLHGSGGTWGHASSATAEKLLAATESLSLQKTSKQNKLSW